MRDLHIVMLMAGRGSRFSKAGFTTPKPLIPVDGQPMMLKALSSLDGITAKKHYTMVIRGEHDREFGLKKQLLDALPEANIITTDDEPVGATRDAYRIKDVAQADEGVIILDCDLWFSGPEYNQMVEDTLAGQLDIDGGLLTFPADHPRYSYAEVGPDGLVVRTAEKIVISDRAITGAYFYANLPTFLRAAEQLMAKPLDAAMPEYFLSHTYNELLAGGGKIKAAWVDGFASFGTPEELEAHEAGAR